MNRKMILSLLLVLAGAVVYLVASDGPLRVRIVTIPVHVVYLSLVSWLAWGLELRPATRLTAIAAVVMVGSLGAVYLDSLMIMALRPLTAAAIALGVLGYALEAALFLAGTLVIDRAVDGFRPASK